MEGKAEIATEVEVINGDKGMQIIESEMKGRVELKKREGW